MIILHRNLSCLILYQRITTSPSKSESFAIYILHFFRDVFFRRFFLASLECLHFRWQSSKYWLGVAPGTWTVLLVFYFVSYFKLPYYTCLFRGRKAGLADRSLYFISRKSEPLHYAWATRVANRFFNITNFKKVIIE